MSLPSGDEPLVEELELDDDEQVVDMSVDFLAGVDFVEPEVVGLRTPAPFPRVESCWW